MNILVWRRFDDGCVVVFYLIVIGVGVVSVYTLLILLQ